MQLNKRRAHRLSARLQVLADLVPECRRLIDIGTDHAWLPIELTRIGRCQEALAVDIRPGPLDIARHNVLSAGLADRIRVRQGDGLEGLTLAPDDAVVLAGLGGYEMMDILGSEPRVCRRLVLQPMKSLPELRIWLSRRGYAIEAEKLAMERKQVYVILGCRHDGVIRELSLLESLVGPVLLAEPPAPGLPAYLEHVLVRLRKQCLGEPVLLPAIRKIEDLAAGLPAASRDELDDHPED